MTIEEMRNKKNKLEARYRELNDITIAANREKEELDAQINALTDNIVLCMMEQRTNGHQD